MKSLFFSFLVLLVHGEEEVESFFLAHQVVLVLVEFVKLFVVEFF